MKSRVTLREVAEKAGVSIATASRAINEGSPCSDATRKKVLKVVKDLGYVADRFVGALSQYRSRKKAGPLTLSVVWLIDSKITSLDPLAEAIYTIFLQQGKEHGFNVCKAYSHEHGRPERCSQVLFNRGVDGIILTNVLSEEVLQEFEWSRFSVVSFLQENFFVPFDVVREHYFRSFFDSWKVAMERGHRRIGVVLPSSHYSRQNETFASVSAYFHLKCPEAVPDLILVPAKDGRLKHYPQEVVAWFEKYRPSLVIGKNEGVYHFLRSAGYSCPGDFQFIVLRRGFAFREISGFELNYSMLANSMLEKLSSKIYHGRKGQTEDPTMTLVPSVWREGSTLSDGTS